MPRGGTAAKVAGFLGAQRRDRHSDHPGAEYEALLGNETQPDHEAQGLGPLQEAWNDVDHLADAAAGTISVEELLQQYADHVRVVMMTRFMTI